jgi:hypothetical protein
MHARSVALQACDILLWCATLLSTAYVAPASRRMVNLTYGLLMLSLNLMLILSFLLLELLVADRAEDAEEAAALHTLDAHAASSAAAAAKDIALDATIDASATMPRASVVRRPASPLSSLVIEAINRNSLPFFLLVRRIATAHQGGSVIDSFGCCM